MRKFKVGDRVRVTGDTAGVSHEFPAGHVGTVDRVHAVDRELYRITDAGWVSEADLERVSDDLPAPDSVTEQNGVPIARWDWDPTVVPVIARGRVVVAGPYRFNLDMGDDPHAFISALLAATETARNNPPEQ